MATDKTEKLAKYKFDTASLFNTGDFQQNGIIGLDYKRIRFHISDTKQKEGELEFIISGKSNVSENICDFKGTLKVLKVFEITDYYAFPLEGLKKINRPCQASQFYTNTIFFRKQ